MILSAIAHRQYNLHPSSLYTPVRLIVPFASLQASTDTHEDYSTGILRKCLDAAALTVIYGLPHLIDFTILFALVSLTGGDHVGNGVFIILLIFYLHQIVEHPSHATPNP